MISRSTKKAVIGR